MMTIMYPNYEQYPKYENYENYENYDHDQNDWGFFVNLDDLYDHQQLSQNNIYIDNYKKQQKRINYMPPIREVNENRDTAQVAQRVEVFRLYSLRNDGVNRRNIERNVDIDIIDNDEFGWYVPDKLPNKPQHKFEQRDMHMQRDMDIRETYKRTKININIEYDYDDKNAFMKSCLNTCIVLGISIGCSIFIVLF